MSARKRESLLHKEIWTQGLFREGETKEREPIKSGRPIYRYCKQRLAPRVRATNLTLSHLGKHAVRVQGTPGATTCLYSVGPTAETMNQQPYW